MRGYEKELFEFITGEFAPNIRKAIRELKQTSQVRERGDDAEWDIEKLEYPKAGILDDKELYFIAVGVIVDMYIRFEPKPDMGHDFNQFQRYANRALYGWLQNKVFRLVNLKPNWHYEEGVTDKRLKFIPALPIVDLGDDWDGYSDDTADPEEILLRQEECEMVRKAVNRLPEKQRQTIILIFWNNYDYEQIANTMGVEVAAAWKNGSRAMEKLTVWLKEMMKS